MGFLQRMSSTVAPARMSASTPAPDADFWYSPVHFGADGAPVSPELALSLSYVYCAVDTISADFGSMPCSLFEDKGDDTRARVKYSDPGVGLLARMLRWAPNNFQTGKAFWSTLAWQYLLRPSAYAEIEYRPGIKTLINQLIPRHPDRVTEEVLPSGRVRFKLREPDGTTRIVLQDEMFVIRNTSMTGIRGLGRMDYGSKAIASALELQKFTTNYFKKGVTAALLATYKGEMEPEDESALHGSITRYMSGAENAGGLMLVPEEIDIKPLGVSAHDAELIGLKNISGRDVARLFKMPPSWLGIEGAASYSSQLQDAENYKNRAQIPMVVEFEQAIQRDLIESTYRFFAKFNMDYLTRGNLLERMQAYEIAIRSRVLRPSEARVREDMNPDDALDRLSEGDNRPGTAGGQQQKPQPQPQQQPQPEKQSARASLKSMLAMHDNALRCLRRERAAVGKLAVKHANDADGWKSALKEFYADHAGFVGQAMRLEPDAARGYAAQHGTAIEAAGVVLLDDAWERHEAESLVALAIGDAA